MHGQVIIIHTLWHRKCVHCLTEFCIWQFTRAVLRTIHMSVCIHKICELYNTYCYLGQYSGRGRRDETSVLSLLLKLHRPPLLLKPSHFCEITMVDPSQQLQPSLFQRVCWWWSKLRWYSPNSSRLLLKRLLWKKNSRFFTQYIYCVDI